MKDSVIKGTGNSRYMKSSIPESTTLTQLITMLREGSFPFDFNGINEEAWVYIGPALNKNNLLRDDTASALGLPEYPESSIHPTVDDAFMRIANRLYAIAQGGRLVRVLLTDYTGAPCPNFTIYGMHGPQGEVCVTDSGGFVEGVVDSDPATLSTDAFTDLDSISIEISAPSGDITDVSMVFPESAFKNYVSYSTSGTDVFSPICKRIDVTAVGGGGGGGGGAAQAGGGGGGGGYVTVAEDVEFSENVTYTRTVGSGGAGGSRATTSSSASSGGRGGTSTALGVSASGGSGGGTGYANAASGNGNGGTQANNAVNGGAGTVEGFSSFSETKKYGGGGGAGSYYWNYSVTGQTITKAAGSGGSPYGGAGGSDSAGASGKGPGGGGGGGAVKNYESDEDWEVNAYNGASGYAGLIAYRMWHHEEVA